MPPYINYHVGAPYNVLGNQSYTNAAGQTIADTAVHLARDLLRRCLTPMSILVRHRQTAASNAHFGSRYLNALNNIYADVYPVTNLSYPTSASTADFANYGPNGALPKHIVLLLARSNAAPVSALSLHPVLN